MFHKKINEYQSSLYGINFYQSYGNEFKKAEKLLNNYLKFKNANYLKESWEIYQAIFCNIKEKYKDFKNISLEYISPKLLNLRNSNIQIPIREDKIFSENMETILTQLKKTENKLTSFEHDIRIKKINKNIIIIKDKGNPRKIMMTGTNEKEYSFELKLLWTNSNDILVRQLLVFYNILLARDKDNISKNYYIPLGSIYIHIKKSILSSYLECYDSLYELIKNKRISSNLNVDIENKKLSEIYPNYTSGNFLSKVEIFKEILKEKDGTELKQIIFEKSFDSKDWFYKRANYSRTLAVMSIIGYILGLGDRNLNNILMNNENCKIIHKNFDSCFEIANKRNKFPEKVPFRLTRTLIKALDIVGVDGIFRVTSEKIMDISRNNKYLISTILSSFVFEPFIFAQFIVQKTNNNNEIITNGKLLDMKNKQKINFELYNDEFDYNELKKIKESIIMRINDKLTGTDFGIDVLDIEDQVTKLIKQANSDENIIRSYFNSSPFW